VHNGNKFADHSKYCVKVIMVPKVQIEPAVTPLIATIRPPGSKSITNRALICAALADGESHLTGVLDSEDTTVMIEAWRSLGLKIDYDRFHHALTIIGGKGRTPNHEAELFIGNSGTTIRFLTAALATCKGTFRLDGVPRMRERPIGDLLDALRQLGAKVESENAASPNCPPVLIHADGLPGGTATVAGNISSQFLSGLMMAGPMAQSDLNLKVAGELVSVPYVTMTAKVMQAFGARIEDHGQDFFTISSVPSGGVFD
jgi:3-phosphoshikimate 1-carboxyvinyltransferase